VALLIDLLKRQVHFYPATIFQDEADRIGKDFDILVSLGILERTGTPTNRICPTCNSEALEVQIVSDTRAFTLCTQDEYAGRDYFNPNELKQWALSTPHLLSLFQQAIGIKTPKTEENITGLLWDLGAQEVNGAVYHLYFSRNIDEIEKSKLSIVTNLPHSVVFYAGTPHTALPDKVHLVPLVDLMQNAGDKGLSISKELLKQHFPSGVYPTKEGDIELDDNLVLQGEYLLFERERAGVFRKRGAKIRPLAQRIIEHLYDIRRYDTDAKTLDELATALGSTKVSISNEIGRVNKICADNNLQEILHKYSGEKWGINQNLSSCK
jgi:hypothetical protein